MALVALIMAGGKGTRMISNIEKPLIKINGTAMLEWVIKALKGASGIEEIYVATSPYTYKTKSAAVNLGMKIIDTQGLDYVTDAQQAIRKLIPKIVLVISADLPQISSELINNIIEEYNKCGKPSLKVVVSINHAYDDETNQISIFQENEYATPSGINVIDSLHINEPHIDEAVLLLNSREIGINVNTPEDLNSLSKKSHEFQGI